ncbi:hypothetical protein JAAARDRAFT_118748, partial [Jaapia argillacea MUCL 33604]
VLHPTYKLSYFWKRKWPDDWIETTVELVHDKWTAHYKPHSSSPVLSTPVHHHRCSLPLFR